MKTSLLFGMLLAAFGSLSLRAADRIWTGGLNTGFNASSNYNNGVGSLGPSDDLIFRTQTSPSLFSTGDTFNFSSLFIEDGATGFNLSGGTITVKGGIYVSENITATISNHINGYNYTDGTPLVFQVGSGGSLTINGVGPQGRPLEKLGEGTLTLLSGSSGNHYIDGIVRIKEGTLILGNDAVLKRTNGSAKTLPVSLGTAETTGKLSGGGAVHGILTTVSAERSIIETGGDGTLFIATVDASNGATFNITLGDLISGDSSFTGNNLDFNFSGGEVGTVYTLLNYSSYVIDTSTFNIASTGYELDATFGDGGWLIDGDDLQVRFAAIPEPGTVAFLSAGALLIAAAGFRRRSHC